MNAKSTSPYSLDGKLAGRNLKSGVCFLMAGRPYACSTAAVRTLAVADLVRSEPESADAAAPTRRRVCRDSGHRLVIRKPGTYQFASTRRTLSLNHKLRAAEKFLVTIPRREVNGR